MEYCFSYDYMPLITIFLIAFSFNPSNFDFPAPLFSLTVDAPLFGHFEEVEGESEERRRARLGRLQRTHERAVCVSLSSFFFVTFCLPIRG